MKPSRSLAGYRVARRAPRRRLVLEHDRGLLRAEAGPARPTWPARLSPVAATPALISRVPPIRGLTGCVPSVVDCASQPGRHRLGMSYSTDLTDAQWGLPEPVVNGRSLDHW